MARKTRRQKNRAQKRRSRSSRPIEIIRDPQPVELTSLSEFFATTFQQSSTVRRTNKVFDAVREQDWSTARRAVSMLFPSRVRNERQASQHTSALALRGMVRVAQDPGINLEDLAIDLFGEIQSTIPLASRRVIRDQVERSLYSIGQNLYEAGLSDSAYRVYHFLAPRSQELGFRRAATLCAGIVRTNQRRYEESRQLFACAIPTTDPEEFVRCLDDAHGSIADAGNGFAARSLVAHTYFSYVESHYDTDNRDEAADLIDEVLNVTQASIAQFPQAAQTPSLYFVDGLRAATVLLGRVHQAQPLLPGMSTHTVFRIGPYVYKAAAPRVSRDESWILNYFASIRSGRIAVRGWTDTLRGYSQNHAPVHRQLESARSLRLPLESMHLERIPSYVEELVGQGNVVNAYGALPGVTLRQALKEDPDPASLLEDAVDQLAIIHAVGPSHLLHKVPFICPRQDEDFVRSLTDRMAEGHGFVEEDRESVLQAYRTVAQRIGQRKSNVFVKDANPLNWIEKQGVTVPIDFESTQLDGPQYDLVKLFEHSTDMSDGVLFRFRFQGEKNPIESGTLTRLLDRYIESYNKAVTEFNTAVGSRYRHEPIEDREEFFQTYLWYVVDFALKSFHDRNYAHQEFAEDKRRWMVRGAYVCKLLSDMYAAVPEHDALNLICDTCLQYTD
ncbi:hypothetical protein GF342_00645 [Candidatus Woesearchaeota archaeon]|nr:hypothetical protein [Candidatus Woesearchaeota archaeon]